MTTEAIQHETSEQANLWEYVERTKPQIEDALQKFLPLAPAEIETEFNEGDRIRFVSGRKTPASRS